MDTSKEFKTPVKNKRNRSTSQSPRTPHTPHTPGTPTVDQSIRRRVSDICVYFHKCVQTWEIDNQASFNTANTLCNLYSQWNDVTESNDVEEINEIVKRKYRVKLISTREDLIKQLIEHRQKLKKLIDKMTGFVCNLKAIYYLGLVSDNNNESFSDDGENTSVRNLEPVIFTSWPAEKFHYTAKIILNMYSKEFLLKESFYERFLQYRVHEKTDEGTNGLSQCISVWLHQPFIDTNCKFLLDSMLVEAELK